MFSRAKIMSFLEMLQPNSPTVSLYVKNIYLSREILEICNPANEQMGKSADLGGVPKANLLHHLDRASGVMELTDSPLSL